MFEAQSADYRQKVAQIFNAANFINELGIKLDEIEPGLCRASVEIQPKHLQQDNFIHAGVQATLADHTAGASAGSLMRDDEIVLTVEFKINLLRPAVGQKLRCEGKVLRAGRTLIVAESEVYAINDGTEKLCAKATVTLAVVKQT